MQWKEKGCFICRGQWLSGRRPPQLAVEIRLHTRLYRCAVCGSYWEENERYSDVLSEDAVRADYPGIVEKEDYKMKDFLPENEIEIAMMKAKSGFLPAADLMQIFLEANLIVPSAEKVSADGSGFVPLEFSKEGSKMLACFSENKRSEEFNNVAPYHLQITGYQLLKRLPVDYGVVINPGWVIGFEISPQGVGRIIKDFGPLYG